MFLYILGGDTSKTRLTLNHQRLSSSTETETKFRVDGDQLLYLEKRNFYMIPLSSLYNTVPRTPELGIGSNLDLYPTWFPIEVATPRNYAIKEIIDFSACNFAWSGLERQCTVTIFARLNKKPTKIPSGCIMAWNIVITEPGIFHQPHKGIPVDCPALWAESIGNIQATPATMSGRFMMLVTIESACGRQVVAYGVGIDNNHRVVITQPKDLVVKDNLEEYVSNHGSSLAQHAVSKSGDIIRVNNLW